MLLLTSSELQSLRNLLLCHQAFSLLTRCWALPSFPTPQALNVLLLTASELQPLRDLLHFHRQRKCRGGATLFATLYACWSCSLCALLSLCFLGQVRGGLWVAASVWE